MRGGRPSRLALGLYAGSFGALLVAAGFLAAAVLQELRGMGLVWASSAMSILAAALAVSSLLVPGRDAG